MGTNLALLQFIWMLVSGALLPSAGGDLSGAEIHWAIRLGHASGMGGLSGGCLADSRSVRLWQEQIEGLPGWHVHRHEGYRAITVDVTAFWRPALANCPSQHYHPRLTGRYRQ